MRIPSNEQSGHVVGHYLISGDELKERIALERERDPSVITEPRGFGPKFLEVMEVCDEIKSASDRKGLSWF